jgi:hypothetical protein
MKLQMGWKLVQREKIVKTTLLSLALFITLLCQYLTVHVLGKKTMLQMGNGGWQSACCTTMVSMYPLAMNPNKKGYRFQVEK